MEHCFREKIFYLYKFISDCLPIYALYTILFREKGLSITQIAYLLSFWSLAVLLLELPSGILADRWNRRNLLCLSTILKALCFLLWSFSNTMVMFGLGFVFWGIAGAFISGTEEGLIYDNLKKENREEEFSKIYGKGRFYATMGILIAILSAGILANFISIGTISILSAILCVMNLIFILQLREENFYSKRRKTEKISYLATFFEAAKLCIKNKTILISILFLVLVVSIISYLDEFDALIIEDFGLGYFWISVIYTVRFVFIPIGNRVASKVETKMKSRNKSFFLAILAGLFLLLFSAFWNQFAILALGLACMIMTIADVIQIDIIQREIHEEGRTTVMSIYSILQNMVMIFFGLSYAFLADRFDLNEVYHIISIFCMAGAVVMYAVNRRNNKRERSNYYEQKS